MTLTLPDVPSTAEPLRRTNEPLLPLDVVPVLIDTAPLRPFAPLYELRRVKAPLLLLEP